MTVADLIEKLAELDQRLPVAVADGQGRFYIASTTVGTRTITQEDADYSGEFETEVGKEYAVLYT